MFETKEITIKGDTYTLKKFPTIAGMKLRKELFTIHQNGESVPPVEFQIKVICDGATVNNIQIDQKKFESHFRGKLDVMDQLFSEILEFNFKSEEDVEGNDQDATAE
jgi:hypothetical protein